MSRSIIDQIPSCGSKPGAQVSSWPPRRPARQLAGGLLPRAGAGVARAVFLAALCGALVTGCLFDDNSVSVSRSQLVGTWESGSSGSISLLSDNTFTTPGLVLKGYFLRDCHRGPATGTWSFYSGGDHGIGDTSKNEGPVISIDFAAKDGDCFFDLDARKAKKGVKLCVTMDPDSVCDGGIYFSKIPNPEH